MIGLGCMRLSTVADRDDERATQVIRAALDAGATLLDTADAYCHDDGDTGHNERLVARALAGWTGAGGHRATITVATKGGMRRPRGAWVADGRAKHLRDACDASRRALGVDTIDLYQLHVVDPKTPLVTSVRALARLQEEGKIRDVGLCNVTVSQIKTAQAVIPIASVQVSLSPFDDDNLRNGVAEYCRDSGIRVIAHRPLGGERAKRLARDPVLSAIAARLGGGATAQEIALAWLMSFGRTIVPIPGATRVETAASIGRARGVELNGDDLAALDARFSGRLLRLTRAQRRPRADARGEVVVVMGMPGAGKSTVARDFEAQGYKRLNRDTLGGALADLVPHLDDLLGAGECRVVLDNTYPTRGSRNEVIEASWRRGVPVRCVWVATDVANAQINCIRRMLDAHGRLPTPEEIRERGGEDTRYLLPDALFRYERMLEPPDLDEGFTAIDVREPGRAPEHATSRALLLDLDDVLGRSTPALHTGDVVLDAARRDSLTKLRHEGWALFVHAWRPQIERGETTMDDVGGCFAQLHAQLGADVTTTCCPHEAGPPVCWCRKPIPGSALEFAIERGVSLERSVVVGSASADRTMAERIGARFESSGSFFG